jgi:hypothetical protein
MTSWRDVLSIHPATDLFPPMSPHELRVLGKDIIKNGLTSSIVLWRANPKGQPLLLDGRSRLDAIELVTHSPIEVGPPNITAGKNFLAINKVLVLDKSVDPYAYVISANIHRRHLTAEQKRELIAKVLKAQPEKSDREIGSRVRADHKTVAKVRRERETTGDISPVEKRVGGDKKARKQPAPRTTGRKRPPAPGEGHGPSSNREAEINLAALPIRDRLQLLIRLLEDGLSPVKRLVSALQLSTSSRLEDIEAEAGAVFNWMSVVREQFAEIERVLDEYAEAKTNEGSAAATVTLPTTPLPDDHPSRDSGSRDTPSSPDDDLELPEFLRRMP